MTTSTNASVMARRSSRLQGLAGAALVAAVLIAIYVASTPGNQWWQSAVGGFLIAQAVRWIVKAAVAAVAAEVARSADSIRTARGA